MKTEEQFLDELFACNQRPMFIPLKTQFFEAFERGEKTHELRLYGARWNENTCKVGRRVVLSKGYGMKRRLTGTIVSFEKRSGYSFGKVSQDAIFECFGKLDVEIACIGIRLDARS